MLGYKTFRLHRASAITPINRTCFAENKQRFSEIYFSKFTKLSVLLTHYIYLCVHVCIVLDRILWLIKHITLFFLIITEKSLTSSGVWEMSQKIYEWIFFRNRQKQSVEIRIWPVSYSWWHSVWKARSPWWILRRKISHHTKFIVLLSRWGLLE